MKKMQYVVAALVIAMSFTVHAQQASQQQDTSAAQNSNGSAANDNKVAGQSTADTAGAAGAASQANASNQGQQTSSEDVSNTPAISQETTSGSGSPAVLSGKNGTARDGTNNIQRASMNMAGSPVGNVRLGESKPEGVAEEMKDRQGYTQQKQASAQRAKTTGTTAPQGSGQINDNNRKENNDLSDQNLSAKDKNNSGREKKPKKSRRKSNRKTG